MANDNTFLIDFNKDLTSVSGDLALVKNERAIVESLKNLLSIEEGDIPNSSYGTRLKSFLLKKATMDNAYEIMSEINNAINYFIPEITKHVVNVYLKKDTYDIEIIVENMSLNNGKIRFLKSLAQLR